MMSSHEDKLPPVDVPKVYKKMLMVSTWVKIRKNDEVHHYYHLVADLMELIELYHPSRLNQELLHIVTAPFLHYQHYCHLNLTNCFFWIVE